MAHPSISAGRYTYGHDTISVAAFGGAGNIRIGSFCSISLGVTMVLGGQHRMDWVTTYPFGHLHVDELGPVRVPGHAPPTEDIVIGDDVWLALHVTVLSGVTIGPGAVVGARAVVAGDVAPYTVVAGNPARPIRTRFAPHIVELLLRLRWWDLPVEDIRELVPTLSAAPEEATLRALVEQYRSSGN